MKKFLFFLTIIALTGFFFFSTCSDAVLASETMFIKKVKRLPKGQYVLNEHQELIGEKYNTKFYGEDAELEKGVVFSVSLVNKELTPYSVYLFYKTSEGKELKKQVITVDSPKRKRKTIRFKMSSDQLKEQGYPDFWWVELRDVSGEEVIDEKGLKNYKDVKKRLQLIEKT